MVPREGKQIMELRIYPAITAQLGGATLARIGKRITSVQVQGRVFKMPTSQARFLIDDGIRLADAARAYAYSHA